MNMMIPQPLRRTKRGKKRSRPPAAEEFVKVIPVQLKDDDTQPMQLSKARKAKAMKLASDQLTVTSSGGYRTVQSNKGVHEGTWYFEIDVLALGPTGHCRLGVGTTRQEVEGPCGYSQESFGFRDTDGAKVSEAWRHPYGAAYRVGDTVGVYMHLPQGGQTMEAKAEIVRWKGRLFQTVNDQLLKAKPLKGSILGYTVNGEWQGVAFKDFLEGTYYAAGSLFTKPSPDTPASIAFNFGPDFKHDFPKGEGLPLPRPFYLAGVPVEGETPPVQPGPTPASADESSAPVRTLHPVGVQANGALAME